MITNCCKCGQAKADDDKVLCGPCWAKLSHAQKIQFTAGSVKVRLAMVRDWIKHRRGHTIILPATTEVPSGELAAGVLRTAGSGTGASSVSDPVSD